MRGKQVTTVKTLKGTTYPVTDVKIGTLIGRQPSGKVRKLTVKDVGRARYDAAVAHFFASQKEVSQ